MATHSRILTWRIPWTEKSGGGGLQSMGSQESDTTERLNTHTHTHAYAYTRAHTHAHARIRTCTYTHAHAHTHTSTSTHTHIHTCTDSKKLIPKKAFQ